MILLTIMPNWHREGPHRDKWEKYRATWVTRHGRVVKWGGRIQKGGARARRRGPSTVDKIAYVASNFVTTAPSFSAAARVLAGQAYKGVYYRGSGRGRGRPKKGGAVDIHKAIGKLPKIKGEWTFPGHKYTGPYNDLDNQIKYNPKTGEILVIYDPPTGKTDAIAMQHDVDYAVCKDDKKCKHIADRKMVRSLDAVPWNERQWGHWLTRNIVNTKQKVGLGNPKGVKKTTENESRLRKIVARKTS